MLEKLSVSLTKRDGSFAKRVRKVLMATTMVTSFFSFKGLSADAETFNDVATASVFAIGTGVAFYAFWDFTFRSAPEWETIEDKVKGLGIVGAGMAFILALSSTYNVVGVDGGSIMSFHQGIYVEELADERAKIEDGNTVLTALEADIRQGEARYRTLAESEKGGGTLSGSGGTGAVHSALVGTADRLGGLLSEVTAFRERAVQIDETARRRLDRMRAIINSSDPFAKRDRDLKTEADRLRSDFASLDAEALSDAIARTVSGLSSEVELVANFSNNTGTEARQRAAIERLRSEIANTAASLNAAFAPSAIEEENDEVFPAYVPISPTGAVREYWPQLLPQWSGGIAMDAMPLALLAFALLSLNARPRKVVDREALLETPVSELIRLELIWAMLQRDPSKPERVDKYERTLFDDLDDLDDKGGE